MRTRNETTGFIRQACTATIAACLMLSGPAASLFYTPASSVGEAADICATHTCACTVQKRSGPCCCVAAGPVGPALKDPCAPSRAEGVFTARPAVKPFPPEARTSLSLQWPVKAAPFVAQPLAGFTKLPEKVPITHA